MNKIEKIDQIEDGYYLLCNQKTQKAIPVRIEKDLVAKTKYAWELIVFYLDKEGERQDRDIRFIVPGKLSYRELQAGLWYGEDCYLSTLGIAIPDDETSSLYRDSSEATRFLVFLEKKITGKKLNIKFAEETAKNLGFSLEIKDYKDLNPPLEGIHFGSIDKINKALRKYYPRYGEK